MATADDGEGVECPTCARSFDTERGMKIHHKKVHGESIAGAPTDCAWCGDTVRKIPSLIEQTERSFCSTQCESQWKSENKTGTQHPQFEGEVVECEQCNDDIHLPPSRLEDQDQFFCDHSCYGEWRSDHVSGENHPQYDRRGVTCSWCDSVFEVAEHRATSQERFFCDRDCLGQWKSENWVGENNPLYKGGRTPYGAGWTDERKDRIREANDYQCDGCGMSQEDHIDEYGYALEVHHKQKARDFDHYDARNAEENLAPLCVPCHATAEQMAPLYPFAD